MTKNIAISLFFALATVALLGYIWFGQTNQRLAATNNRQLAEQIEFGQRNYEQYCAACHNLDGSGNGPAYPAPALNQLQATKGPGTEAYTTTNGIQKKYGSLRNYIEFTIAYGVRGSPMPAWKANGMRDDQVQAIAAYIMSMQGGAVTQDAQQSAAVWKETEVAKLPPTPTPSIPKPEDPVAAAGYDLFFGAAGCYGCHNVSDKPLAGPGLAGLFGPNGTAAYGTTLPNGEPVNEENVHAWIVNGGGGPDVGPESQDGQNYGPMPARGGQTAQSLPDEDIDKIIAYLKTLER